MATQLKPVCAVIRPGGQTGSKQALSYFPGVSAQSAGTQDICMHLVTIPPGGRANTHLHENHETVMYVLEGEAGMWYGEDLQEHLVVRAGDFLYIPANTPHLPYNSSQTKPATAVIARTDPNEQESVVLMPELDSIR